MAASQVKVLDKALSILSQFLEYDELSLQELQHISGYNRTTLYRLLQSLVANSFLQQDSRTRKYMVSSKLMRLSGAAFNQMKFLPACRPYLKELMKLSGETTFIAVLEGANITIVDLEPSYKTAQVNVTVGKLIPAYATGGGKAILAHLSEDELPSILEQCTYESFTEHTLKNKDTLLIALEETQRLGYGSSRGEYDIDIFATGAPIFGSHGRVVATIVIAALDRRVNGEETLRHHGQLVKEAAKEISQKLGSASAPSGAMLMQH